jgi:hypothetical protein
MTGAEVEKFYRDGHIREIAEYCESDVLNTYRVWLRYELFRGRLSNADFQASEANLVEFVKARGNTKPHLIDLIKKSKDRPVALSGPSKPAAVPHLPGDFGLLHWGPIAQPRKHRRPAVERCFCKLLGLST